MSRVADSKDLNEQTKQQIRSLCVQDTRTCLELAAQTLNDPHINSFVAFCRRCGVDGQEVLNWSDELLKAEYHINAKEWQTVHSDATDSKSLTDTAAAELRASILKDFIRELVKQIS